MKSNLYLSVIITFLLNGTMFSQSYDSLNIDKYFILKFSPFNIIDPVNPSIQFSFEKKLVNRFNLQGEIGYIVPIWHNPYREYNPKYTGFKLRTELRYYLSRKVHKPFGYYTSTELYYTRNLYSSMEGFNKGSDTLEYVSDYYENIRINKNLVGINFKIGYQKQIKNFIIDTYIGVGIKYKDIEHNDRSRPDDEITIPRSFYMSDMIAGKMADEKGKYFTPSFPINIKIGYLF